MNRKINQDNIAVEFKQDYLNLDETVAISSEGIISKVEDVVKDDKVVYTLYKADVSIEVETKTTYTDINITDFKTIKL